MWRRTTNYRRDEAGARSDRPAATDPFATEPSLRLDRAGTCVIQLIVNDGFLDSVPDTVVIATVNSAPVADAGPDQELEPGVPVQLDGSGSFDADDPLEYSWAFTSACLVAYRLEASEAGRNQFFPLASSSAPVVNGVLGSFDPTLLLNSFYDIRLTAEDAAGNPFGQPRG